MSGLIWLILYVLINSFQEVFLGHLFQHQAPILVLVLTFSFTALFFLLLQVNNIKALLKKCTGLSRPLLWINLTTCLAWLGYFLALKYIEPAICSVITFYLGPVLITFISKDTILKSEKLASWGIFIGLLFLATISYFGKSSMGEIPVKNVMVGIALASMGGLGGAYNVNWSKYLYDKGLSPKELLSLRFFLLILLGLFLWPAHPMEILQKPKFWSMIFYITTFMIILPIFILQLGIKKTKPITTTLVLAALPAVTFLLQLFDNRLSFSPLTLIGILSSMGFMFYGVYSRYLYDRKGPSPS